MIGPKLYIPVPGHISLDIVLTYLVISTTFLVYLSVSHLGSSVYQIVDGRLDPKAGSTCAGQCLWLGCFVAAVPFLWLLMN